MTSLTALHTLALRGSWVEDGFGALQRLPRLRHLRLPHLPPCLSRLTGLEELLVGSTEDEDTDALEAALRPLTRLTSL